MQDREAVSALASIDARIARRVRTLRADLGMTLDALSRCSRVSRSMLSLVERGESSPTATVLEKIASGFGVSLATLFEDASAPSHPLSRGRERSTWRDPKSGYLRRNISPANFPSPIQIVEVTLPAGARVAYESGTRAISIHQQLWVRQGRIEVAVGTVTWRLEKDDCLAMRLDAPVTYRNRTRSQACYIVVITSERLHSVAR